MNEAMSLRAEEERPALAGPRLELWTYGFELPSFRYRFASALPTLESRGWRTGLEELPKGHYFLRIWERRERLAASDVLVLAKTRLGLGEARLLRRTAPRIVFDFDDAIYVKQPRRLGQAAEHSRLRRMKFAQTCRAADLVIAGSDALAAEARQYASHVVVLPTPVDLERYPQPGPRRVQADGGRIAVWVGRPENLRYLELVRPAIAELARREPGFKLRVVSSSFPDWPEVPIERVSWSSESEISALSGAAVGLGPLSDDEWTRGKCAFKLLQYMAAGLPCVASPVGANRDAVVAGETGFLASTNDDWLAALVELLASPARCREMGAAGRKRVEDLYDVRVIAPRLADLLAEVVANHH